MSIDIICTDCGRVVSAPNKRTLYCSTHRLARNLQHFGMQTVRCTVCDTRFCPVVAKDILCWKHAAPSISTQGRHHVLGDCKVCDAQAVRLFSAELPVCLPCLRRPDKRREVLRKVLTKAAKFVISSE